MLQKRPVLLLVSAAALTLALQQGALAETAPGPTPAEAAAAGTEVGPASAEAAAPGEATEASPQPEATIQAETPAPAEEAPAAAVEAAAPAQEASAPVAEAPPPEPADPMAAARERMEERHAEMMIERRRQYDELRARAAEVGLQLPEIPPWEQVGMPEMPTPPEMPMPPEMAGPPDMPPFPAMPTPPDMPSPPGMDMPPSALGAEPTATPGGMMPPWKLMTDEEREARRQMMRTLTPEQRQAMRELHWQELRERAKEKGIEMPELPPWKQAEQRREEMRQRWESYRQIVEQMSAEQREAAAAVFGQAPAAPEMPAMPAPEVYGAPGTMPQAPMMPGYGTQGRMPQSWSMPGYGGQGVMPQGQMMPGYGTQGGMPQYPMMRGYGDQGRMLQSPGGYWQGGDRQPYQGPPPPTTGYGEGW